MKRIRYPSIYQINTRVYLNELSRQLGRRALINDIPDEELFRLKKKGFSYLWIMGVWQTGQKSKEVSRTHGEWQAEFWEVLPDLKTADITGSCFAIHSYSVMSEFGGDASLKEFRTRMHLMGLKLILDFVPNHVALDHPWLKEHPSFFMKGNEDDLKREPYHYVNIKRSDEDSVVLAYGSDPYLDGWPDTLQLNYANPELQLAMIGELVKIGDYCDGVRCDMAMLVEPDEFEHTWGIRPEPFWEKAVKTVKQKFPEFLFIAEVYWDKEWELQQKGFDYTYDKRLYDRLLQGTARPVREQLFADIEYQSKMVRFVENHDEERAAQAFEKQIHFAAAIVTYLSPGFRFFHQGQFEGKKVRIPTHLSRGRDEKQDTEICRFYKKLFRVINKSTFKNGTWQLLDCRSVDGMNDSWDNFIGWSWHDARENLFLVFVNYSREQSQCFVQLSFSHLADHVVKLDDLFGSDVYERDGNELINTGLFLNMQAWGIHVFEAIPMKK